MLITDPDCVCAHLLYLFNFAAVVVIIIIIIYHHHHHHHHHHHLLLLLCSGSYTDQWLQLQWSKNCELFRRGSCYLWAWGGVGGGGWERMWGSSGGGWRETKTSTSFRDPPLASHKRIGIIFQKLIPPILPGYCLSSKVPLSLFCRFSEPSFWNPAIVRASYSCSGSFLPHKQCPLTLWIKELVEIQISPFKVDDEWFRWFRFELTITLNSSILNTRHIEGSMIHKYLIGNIC